jgi:glycine/D-amino acid oxidase-like deaminating enzyme
MPECWQAAAVTGCRTPAAARARAAPGCAVARIMQPSVSYAAAQMANQAQQVVVIGGGLAGLSAAHTVLEGGGRVLLLDKVRVLQRVRRVRSACVRTSARKVRRAWREARHVCSLARPLLRVQRMPRGWMRCLEQAWSHPTAPTALRLLRSLLFSLSRASLSQMPYNGGNSVRGALPFAHTQQPCRYL